MATLIPFPGNRRVGSVRKLARQMLNYPRQASADKVLADRLKKLAEQQAGLGIPADIVREDVEKFRAAVQSELWRLVFMPERPHGGAA
jgi:hypothetical protein